MENAGKPAIDRQGEDMRWRNWLGAMLMVVFAGVQCAAAAVGTLHAFEGDIRVISNAGERAAQTGMELNEGDTVKSGAGAWALLAMSDGASLTLRPDTLLKIDVYRYDAAGNAADNSSALSLLKGALRAVTGYIGRSNREGYRINTPTATIGVRGTDHEPAYYPPPERGERMEHEPGTYDKVNDGESFIRNPRGEVGVKPGQHAFVHHNGRVAPRLLARAPAFYQRHAEIDRRAAAHRAEFHRVFEEKHQQQLQEIRQRNGAAAPRAPEKSVVSAVPKRDVAAAEKQEAPKTAAAVDTQEARKAAAAARVEENQKRQEQRREAAEKRQQERQAAQEQRKQQQAEAQKKREAERAAKHEQKKEHEKAAEHHEERRHAR